MEEVHLALPRSYHRFPGPVTPPALPAGVILHLEERDLGPATKILPLAARSDAGTEILYCDDDWLYEQGWAEVFAEKRAAHPEAALAASLWDTARLGLPGGRIAQGFAGVMIRPEMLPDAAWDLPARFVPVDDIWLSGMLAASGTQMVDVPAARALARPSGNEAAALQSGTERAALNRACAEWLSERHGVWS